MKYKYKNDNEIVEEMKKSIYRLEDEIKMYRDIIKKQQVIISAFLESEK